MTGSTVSHAQRLLRVLTSLRGAYKRYPSAPLQPCAPACRPPARPSRLRGPGRHGLLLFTGWRDKTGKCTKQKCSAVEYIGSSTKSAEWQFWRRCRGQQASRLRRRGCRSEPRDDRIQKLNKLVGNFLVRRGVGVRCTPVAAVERLARYLRQEVARKGVERAGGCAHVFTSLHPSEASAWVAAQGRPHTWRKCTPLNPTICSRVCAADMYCRYAAVCSAAQRGNRRELR